MKYFFTSFLFFYFSFSFCQLSEIENKLISKSIKKYKLDKYVESGQSFTHNLGNEIKWNFSNLNFYKFVYKNEEFSLSYDKELKSIVHPEVADTIFIYNENYIVKRYTNNDNGNISDIYLQNRKLTEDYLKNYLLRLNLLLKEFNIKENLENSFLINDIFLSFARGSNYVFNSYFPIKQSFKWTRENEKMENSVDALYFVTANSQLEIVEKELKRLGFFYFKNKEFGSYMEYAILTEKNLEEANKILTKNKPIEDLKNGTYTGYITDYNVDNTTYTGNLVNGKFEGNGTLIFYPNKKTKSDRIEAKYVGNFKNGHFQGQGNLTIKEFSFRYQSNNIDVNYKEIYIGQFYEGKYDGNGKLYKGEGFSDFKTYIGNFKNGMYNGKGILYHGVNLIENPNSNNGNNLIVEGNWLNNELDGFAILKNTYEKNRGYKAVSTVEGNFTNGKRNGKL